MKFGGEAFSTEKRADPRLHRQKRAEQEWVSETKSPADKRTGRTLCFHALRVGDAFKGS